ncbi:MAG: O-antigen ligase domain-containing protein, partial [Pseudomonadota bacterium]
VFVILSFGENIEIETYLLWPAILMLGVHAREMAAAHPAATRPTAGEPEPT